MVTLTDRIPRPEDLEAFLAEARILGQLDHAHVVPVYDVGRTSDGLCYVVSKYIEGSDLAARIKQGRRSFHESAELAAVVAEDRKDTHCVLGSNPPLQLTPIRARCSTGLRVGCSH